MGNHLILKLQFAPNQLRSMNQKFLAHGQFLVNRWWELDWKRDYVPFRFLLQPSRNLPPELHPCFLPHPFI